MQNVQQKEFQGLRSLVFPIYFHEMKKFFSLSLMLCLIIFNYQLLWDAKYTLIVHAAGAEALSLTKLIGVVPGAIIVMLLYTKLSNILSRKGLFFASLIPFLVFFGLFAFVLYPNRELLHPTHSWVEELSSTYPRMTTLFHLFGNWSYVLFFTASELWGSIAISLLFWQLANDIVSMQAAKRFYPLFGLIPNVALIAAGITIRFFSEMRTALSAEQDPWQVTLGYLMAVVIVSGVAILAVYSWIYKNIPFNTAHEAKNDAKHERKKIDLSLKESFLHLARSKHLLFIALIVVCYGVTQNIIEGVWQDQVKAVHDDQNRYSAFMGNLATMVGITTTVFMLIGSNILRYFGWRITAWLTPCIVLSTGLIFFLLVIFKDSLGSYTEFFFQMTPAMLAVWIGFSQDVFTKASKYSFFDPTKEMCYIPLDQETKVKGKAAIDVVGARFGKCGGAFIQQAFLILTASTLSSLAPYFAIICIGCAALWLFAVGKLYASLKELQEEKNQEEKKLEEKKQAVEQTV